MSPHAEREQIVEEFQQRCGSKSAKMDKETFTALMTQLGYPAQHCEQCFRYERERGGGETIPFPGVLFTMFN